MTNLMQNFQRNITYNISFNSDNHIVLTGILKDSLHDIFIEFTIEQECLEIITAIVKFNKSPTIDCRKIEEKAKSFIGVKIGTGIELPRTIIRAFNGGEGCGNLRAMVMGLLPLAINAKAGAGFDTQVESMNSIQEKLTGTCAGYPVVK